MDVLFPVNLVPLVALPVSLVALSRGGDLADLEGFLPSLAAGGSTGGWWVEKQALGNTVLLQHTPSTSYPAQEQLWRFVLGMLFCNSMPSSTL